MSELRADTITASDGTSPVTLTKQEATKFWVTYNAINETTEGSLNQSSLVDEITGRYHSTFTSVFGSATDKCATVNAYSSSNNTSPQLSSIRGGIIANVGTSFDTGTFRALNASEIQYTVNYGAHSTSDGAAADYWAVYVMVIGDLA